MKSNDWEKEYLKRYSSFQNEEFICIKCIFSDELKVFSENWDIRFNILNVSCFKKKNTQLKLYNVDINLDGSCKCDCMDFKLRGKYTADIILPCKHIIYVLNIFNIRDIKNVFLKGQLLDRTIIYDIKNKIVSSDNCMLCMDKIDNDMSDEIHMEKYINNFFDKSNNKIKLNHTNCHDYCICNLYNLIKS
jgi:hypothetical protein